MKINGKIYNLVLEEETIVGTQPICCCAYGNNLSSDSSTSDIGLDVCSSTSEWCEDDILIDITKNKMKEDCTIQSPAPFVKMSLQVSSKKLSGTRNAFLFDRCGRNDGNGMSESKLVVGLPQTEFFNKNSLKPICTSRRQTNPCNLAFSNNGPTLMTAQPAAGGHSQSFVKETKLGLDVGVGPGNKKDGLLNDYTPTLLISKNHNTPLRSIGAAREGLGIAHYFCRSSTHDHEKGNLDVPTIELHSLVSNENTHNRCVPRSRSLIQSKDSPNPDSETPCNVLATKHMTLIKESNLDPKDFQLKRQFWIGESSKNRPVHQNCNVKENSKAAKQKMLRSVAQSICNSLSDENILNCNRLFCSAKCQSNNSESLTIWSLAKELGVTFSGEEEQILKELENREKRYRNQGQSIAGKKTDDNENH